MTNNNTNNSTLSAAEFRRRSYDAYMQYVALIEGKISVADAVKAIAPLAQIYGLTLTPENLLNCLTIRMTSYGLDAGEKSRKIKSISTSRAEKAVRMILGTSADAPEAFDASEQ